MHSFNIVRLAVVATVAAAQLPSGILGFNSGATLDTTKAKQQSDFEAEFKAAQQLHWSPGLFNSVRLYTMVQADTKADPISAFAAAIATNTTMLLGIWCSGTTTISNELKALKTAIDKYGQQLADLVVGISVGSEDLYRASESGIANDAGIGQGPDAIVGFIKNVRDAVKDTILSNKPIGHVDSWSAWANDSNSDVIDAVDFLGTDLYPYYEENRGNDFSNVTAVFDEIYGQAKKAAGNKTVIITETGWPDSGPKLGAATASRTNAEQYWKTIGCGKLFGRVNVWWYNLRDDNSAIDAKFAITDSLSATTHFNLSCPADSGAPSSINRLQSSAYSLSPKIWFAAGISLFIGLATLL